MLCKLVLSVIYVTSSNEISGPRKCTKQKHGWNLCFFLLVFFLVLFLAAFNCYLIMTDELSERRRSVTLAWLNTSFCKEKLEVMMYEER